MLEEERWVAVVRRWMRGRLTFFCTNIAHQKVDKQNMAALMTDFPLEVIAAFSGTALWHAGQEADVINVPQEMISESWEGCISIIQGFLMVVSSNPIHALHSLPSVSETATKKKKQTNTRDQCSLCYLENTLR
jgi:hypothetical protein